MKELLFTKHAQPFLALHHHPEVMLLGDVRTSRKGALTVRERSCRPLPMLLSLSALAADMSAVSMSLMMGRHHAA